MKKEALHRIHFAAQNGGGGHWLSGPAGTTAEPP